MTSMEARAELGSANQGTIDRALTVLAAFASQGEETLGISELHRITGLSKSVVHRIAVKLVDRGFLERDESTQRLRVGLTSWEVGNNFDWARGSGMGLETSLRDFVSRRNMSCFVGILDGREMIYTLSLPSTSELRVEFPVGKRVDAVNSAFGLAALSTLPADRIDSLGLTPTSVRGMPLLDALREIRQKGYSIYERASPAIASVGVPIVSTKGGAAAVSCAFPIAEHKGYDPEALASDLRDSLERRRLRL